MVLFYMLGICIFDRADIDGWEVRKGMADLCAMDLVPEPR